MKDILDVERLLSDPVAEVTRVSNLTDDTWEGIGRALATLPGLYAHAQIRYRIARADESSTKAEYERAARLAFSDLRDRGLAVSHAEKEAELAPEVQAKHRDYLDAERRSGIWYALLRGLDTKWGALQQISSRQKEELRRQHEYVPENAKE